MKPKTEVATNGDVEVRTTTWPGALERVDAAALKSLAAISLTLERGP
jgi:hypothetical protein